MKHYFLIFMVVAGLWSCEHDQFTEEESMGDHYPKHIISILPHAEDGVDLSSRGTPIAGEQQMTDVSVFCAYTGSSDWTNAAAPGKMFDTRLVRNSVSGKWEYSGAPISWSATTNNDRYSFFAYAPYATAQNGIVVRGNSSTTGIPSITYTTPSDVTSQPDLMVAVPRYNLRPSTSIVSFQMKHALTCVGFSVIGKGEKVVSATISGVINQGTLALDANGIWTNLGTASFSLNAGINPNIVLSSTPQNILNGNGYLMMIPQRLTNATLKIVLDNNVTKTFALNTQPDWKAGQKVQYTILVNSLAGGFGDRITVKDGVLSITNNPNEPSLYFKCGSVVGISSSVNIANLAFNPTVGIPIAIFGNNTNVPPAVPGLLPSDFDSGQANLSQNYYHNLANVRIGKGDPCRLIGMTAAEIKTFANDDALYAREAALKNSGVGGWRLPTNIEADAFSGGSGLVTTVAHWWSADTSIYGNPKVVGGEFPARNTSGISKFLPALGILDAFSGKLGEYNMSGRYWQGDIKNGNGYHLVFTPSSIFSSATSVYTHGMSVRCVRVP